MGGMGWILGGLALWALSSRSDSQSAPQGDCNCFQAKHTGGDTVQLVPVPCPAGVTCGTTLTLQTNTTYTPSVGFVPASSRFR